MTSIWTDEDVLRGDAQGHEALLRRVNAAIGKLEADRIEAARASAAGWPVYSAAERQQRERDAVEAFKQALGEEEEVLAEQITRFEQQSTNLVQAQQNPLSRLPTEDLTRASALRGFVEADVARLSGPELAAQVEQIAAAGDRGVMATWHHVLLTRAQELQGDARVLYAAAVDKLGERLRDETIEKKLKATNKRLEQARAARAKFWEATRAARVQLEREQLVASGGYERIG